MNDRTNEGVATKIEKALLQQAIDRIQKIATQACQRRDGEFQPLTYSETHALRAAATAWSEHVARKNGLTVEDEKQFVISQQEVLDNMLETSRYLLDPH